jgi:hypothetical protein
MWMAVKKVAVYADAVNLACLTRLKLAQSGLACGTFDWLFNLTIGHHDIACTEVRIRQANFPLAAKCILYKSHRESNITRAAVTSCRPKVRQLKMPNEQQFQLQQIGVVSSPSFPLIHRFVSFIQLFQAFNFC